MTISRAATAALCSGALLVLQGCGGSGPDAPSTSAAIPTTPTPTTPATTLTDSTAPSTTTTTIPTTTTTTTTLPRSPPLTGEEAAAYLNHNYKAFDAHDSSSSPGVVMRTADTWGFFCQGFADYQGCYNGFARCITSASILNNQVMLLNGDQIMLGLRRTQGIMINTSMVEERLARCSYQFDGTSWGRYNRGCGSTAPNGPGMCDDKTSAWWDIDPATGKEVEVTSNKVLHDYCPTRMKAHSEPTSSGQPPCFWKGPAFDSKNGFIKSETHKMMKQRLKNQEGEIMQWDEVVLDAEIMLEELRRDPARVVPAMVYADSGDEALSGIAKRAAQHMAEKMQREFNMAAPVPVVGIDTQLHISAQPLVPGPFFFGQKYTTQTTTTTPRTTAGCCHGNCHTDCKPPSDWCSWNAGNCEGSCDGKWCPAPLFEEDEDVLV